MHTPRPLRVDPAHPFAGPVLRAMGGEGAALDEAASVLHAAETACGIGLTFWTRETSYPLCDADVPEATVASFLDATSLVIDGGSLQIYFLLLDRELYEREFSWRDWGHHMAAWANRTFPVPASALAPRQPSPCPCEQCAAARAGEWLYVDFYMGSYLNRFFADYARWLECVELVVRRKVERFGPPFGAASQP